MTGLGFSPLVALADPALGAILPGSLKESMMTEAKLAPNLPDWMVKHANRYLASGGPKATCTR